MTNSADTIKVCHSEDKSPKKIAITDMSFLRREAAEESPCIEICHSTSSSDLLIRQIKNMSF